MSLTSAMLVGFTGIRSNQTTVDTVGDNIANLNTTAFKGQRALFETLLYETVSEGSGPTPESGGTLPRQIGRGSTVAVIQRNFGQGAVEATGIAQDVALNGKGFFVLDNAAGGQVYTRDGAFRLDASQTLVSPNGAAVQGFLPGADGQIDRAALGNLVIPLGTESQAIATTSVIMDGGLDALDDVAAAGRVISSQPLVTANGASATAATPLVDLVDVNGVPLFANDDVVSIRASKGEVETPPFDFTVGATGSTLGDFASFLETRLGIAVDSTREPSAGVTVAAATEENAGALVIGSNHGLVNAIGLESGGVVNTRTGVTPFDFAVDSEAVGQGVTTSFRVFDSLGAAVDVRLRMAMESKTTEGAVWRYYAESGDDTDLSPILGTGTVTFDQNGQFTAAQGTDIQIDRAGTGAATPMTVSLDFSGLTGLASPSGESEVFMASQDGAPAGILVDYGIDEDGVLTGGFSNGREQVLGQLAVATFINDEGLIASSDNTFLEGPNSGAATVGVANEGVAGSVVAGALEQGNVELIREFINLISAATGISASSRVVRASDDMLQELILLGQ